MLIELVEGFFIDPKTGLVVKSTGKNECALFTAGQSAVDGGFRLDCEAEQAAKELNNVLASEEDGVLGDEDEDD